MSRCDELLDALANLRSGLIALASMLNDVEEAPPPHQLAELMTVFADAATKALGDAAPLDICPE